MNYTYNDYEEAYYKSQFTDCKKIGICLLSKMTDKYSKKLLKELKKFEWDWLNITKKDYDLLLQVKLWLMVNN